VASPKKVSGSPRSLADPGGEENYGSDFKEGWWLLAHGACWKGKTSQNGIRLGVRVWAMHGCVAAGYRLQGCKQGPSLDGALARFHVATKLSRCNFPIQILYEKNSWKADAFFPSSALGCNGASSQPISLSPSPAPSVFPYLTLPSLCDLFSPLGVYKAAISLLFASFLPSPQQPTHFLIPQHPSQKNSQQTTTTMARTKQVNIPSF